jgi:hypothetical protein
LQFQFQVLGLQKEKLITKLGCEKYVLQAQITEYRWRSTMSIEFATLKPVLASWWPFMKNLNIRQDPYGFALMKIKHQLKSHTPSILIIGIQEFDYSGY